MFNKPLNMQQTIFSSIIEAKDTEILHVIYTKTAKGVCNVASRKPYQAHTKHNHTLAMMPQAHKQDHSPTTEEHSLFNNDAIKSHPSPTV